MSGQGGTTRTPSCKGKSKRAKTSTDKVWEDEVALRTETEGPTGRVFVFCSSTVSSGQEGLAVPVKIIGGRGSADGALTVQSMISVSR